MKEPTMKNLRANLEKHFYDNKFNPKSIALIMGDFDSYVEQNPDCTEDACLAFLKAKWFKPSKAGDETPAEAKASAQVNYRGCLFNALANKTAGLSQGAIVKLMDSFDALVKQSPDKERDIFEKILSEYGNSSVANALKYQSMAASLDVRISTPVSRMICEHLEEINQQPYNKDQLPRRKMEMGYFARLAKGCSATLLSPFVGRETEILSQAEKDAVGNFLSPKQRRELVAMQSWASAKDVLRSTLRGLQFEREI
jgi:hypothetical protein